MPSSSLHPFPFFLPSSPRFRLRFHLPPAPPFERRPLLALFPSPPSFRGILREEFSLRAKLRLSSLVGLVSRWSLLVCGREEEGMLEPAGAGDYGKNGGSSVGRLTDVAAIRGDEDSAHFLTQVPLLRRSSGRCKWNRFSLFCRDESSRRRASGNSRFFLPRSPLPSRAPVNGFRTLFSSRIFFLEKSVLRTLFPSSFPLLSLRYFRRVDLSLTRTTRFFLPLFLSLSFSPYSPLGIFEGIFSFRFPRSTSLFSRASCCSSFAMNQSSRQIDD